ncbi:mitochondrial inner membrane protease ATP23 homolog [Aplysia californica]|uniref:Mitochondrial inner membrane protease ATP23 n=1 Tax=Aplysia californica TaxID=6500 RepID=A0ABM0JL44_APLCA|nr:mitochondrial inner membrane protease ATP23 homolog [Aplysia californica]
MAAPSETKVESEKLDNKEASQKKGSITDEEDFGYYFYPDREGKKKTKSFFNRVFYHEDVNHFKCITNVRSCMQSNPMVKLMVGALESHGCPVNMERHVSCETCLEKVSGGFDPKSMQVVVCQNNVNTRDVCCNVLAHELLHAFDFCRAKVDFENLRHLACTEIRAANMNHCSLAAAFATGDMTPLNIKERHQLCVKNKALQSIMLVRNVSQFDAMLVVDEVFDKCYNDTEPYGRRCFKDMNRAKRALDQGRNYYDFV